MPNFQHVGVEVDVLGQEAAFRFTSRIAGEEHPKTAIFQQKSDRVAIDGIAPADKGQRRTDEVKYDAVIGMPARCRAWVKNRYALGACRRDRISVGMAAVLLSTVDDLSDSQPPQRGSDPAGVVAVRVRDHDGINAMDAVSLQKRHNGSLADAFRDGAVGLRAALEPAARIDEQRVTARRLNDNRIGLPDIENRHAQAPIDSARRAEHPAGRHDEPSGDNRLGATFDERRSREECRSVECDAPGRRRSHRNRCPGKRADSLNDCQDPPEQP